MPARSDPPVAPSFKAALGEQLVMAHGRLLRRRKRRRQAAVTVAAVIVLAFVGMASLSMFDSKPAAADVVSVELQADGSRLVTIEHAEALPDELHDALRREGIENNTVGVVTGPSRVGTLLTVTLNGAQATPDPTSGGRSLLIPPGFGGVVGITIGKAAQPGQSYEQPTSAFDPGEPLAGFAQRMDLAAVTAAANAKGLCVVVMGADEKPLPSPPPGAVLIAATMISSDVLNLRIAG